MNLIEISGEETGMRLDAFLSSCYVSLSRSYLQKLIGDGHILVENGGKSDDSDDLTDLGEARGKTVKNGYKLREGDRVYVTIPAETALSVEPENIPLDVVYEDGDVILVNKPKNMVVHPAAGHMSGTLVNALLYHCRDLSGINGVLRPGIVHRIDKDTTGIVIACKNDEAHRKIAEQFAVHSNTRAYRAVVTGNVKEDEGTIDKPIGRDKKDRKKMAVDFDGKPAVTHYKVLQRFGQYTYMEFRLETGRTHQIRVHMASAGHPLLGDTVYSSGKSPFKTEGQVLHAYLLGFKHPKTGEYMEFETELPEYFKTILRALENG